jgi:proteasome assembly chaperone (PAC2) family protein
MTVCGPVLQREIIAVCSQIHTKHINTLGGQNVELLNVKLAVYTATSGVYDI